MATIPELLALASITLLYSAMLVAFSTSCLFPGDLICTADLVGAAGPLVGGFTENKQARLGQLFYFSLR